MGKINYFNFFTEIEDFFLKKRKKGILISPLDWTLIETWKEMGIPLHIVLRGIERAFTTFQKREKKFSRINSLFYCNQAVMEEFEKYILSMDGGDFSEEETEEVRDENILGEKLKNLLNEQLKSLETLKKDDIGEELFERVKGRVSSLIEEVSGKELDLDNVERSLKEIDELMVKYLERISTSELLREIKKEVNRDIRKYRSELPKKMVNKIKEKYFQKKLKEKYGLRDFSILELL